MANDEPCLELSAGQSALRRRPDFELSDMPNLKARLQSLHRPGAASTFDDYIDGAPCQSHFEGLNLIHKRRINMYFIYL